MRALLRAPQDSGPVGPLRTAPRAPPPLAAAETALPGDALADDRARHGEASRDRLLGQIGTSADDLRFSGQLVVKQQ